MPRYLLPSVPRRGAARKMAGLLQRVGWGAGLGAAAMCAALCLFGGGALHSFTNRWLMVYKRTSTHSPHFPP